MTKQELRLRITEEMVEYSKDHLVFHEEKVFQLSLEYHTNPEEDYDTATI